MERSWEELVGGGDSEEDLHPRTHHHVERYKTDRVTPREDSALRGFIREEYLFECDVLPKSIFTFIVGHWRYLGLPTEYHSMFLCTDEFLVILQTDVLNRFCGFSCVVISSMVVNGG